MDRYERNRTREERERDRELGLAFSEKIREAYEAKRYRSGLEWLEGRENPADPGEPPDEAA